jgi:hypothetical protein
VTADPGARGDQWPRAPGAYADRGPAGFSSSGGTHSPGPPWGEYDPPEPPRGAGSGDRRVRARRAAAVIALILGLTGFAVSAFGVAIQLLPRHFTASQQRQIEAWEVMRRWHTMPAGRIFPASVSYQLPARVLQGTVPLSLDAIRVSIAPQESDCAKAVTSEPAAAVLRRNGCEAVLRATYVDATRSYVMTVGVAVLPNAVAAASADSGLATPRLAVARQASIQDRLPGGVLLVRFRGAGAGRYDYHRQISASFTAGPYLVMYAAGYADNRPRVPVTQDKYSDAEMTSMAQGVARTVAQTLAASPAPPHCPGAPGC